MKSNSSTAAFRYFVCLVFHAAILFIFLNAVIAQTTNKAVVKPKAILVAEWSNRSGDQNQVKSLPERPRGTAESITGGINSFLSAPQKNQFADIAVEPKSLNGRFASLKPTALEEKAFDLLNAQRVLQHLQPLQWDLEMLYLAREHSENMARLNFFSHEGRDGKMADDRANDLGIKDWSAIGENIAFNQGVKNNVESAVEGWTNSARHKQNLLDKKWTRSGIGIAQTPEGRFYITQVFRD